MQAAREQAAAVGVPAVQAVVARVAAQAVAQQAADGQAVAAADAPALLQAAAPAGAAVQKHTAVDTGAAEADEGLHAPHEPRRAQY